MDVLALTEMPVIITVDRTDPYDALQLPGNLPPLKASNSVTNNKYNFIYLFIYINTNIYFYICKVYLVVYTGFILFLEVQIPRLFMTFHDQKSQIP